MSAFFTTYLHAPWMLAGLALLVLPPLIHLLNRRRHVVLDWGAMQFLEISQATRRRLLLEEILLMLLRIALLGVLVLALAGPFFETTSSTPPPRAPRDVVLLIDGSASMAVSNTTTDTPYDRALAWAKNHLDQRSPGDQVAVFLVRDRVVPLFGSLTPDLQRVRAALANPPPPAGGADWPAAVRQAYALFARNDSTAPGPTASVGRQILILSDNQKALWADTETLFRWELLANELGLAAKAPRAPASRNDLAKRPTLRILDFSADRPAQVPNYALTPLTASRPTVPVDREVTFRSELLITGQTAEQPPHRLRIEVDGKPIRDLKAPPGKGPITFTHRFNQPGTRRVSLVVEPDPPPGDRKPDYVIRDRVPSDNRQEVVVEVIDGISVLIVDGSSTPGAEHGAGFLRDALSPAREEHPVARTRVIPATTFAPSLLQGSAPPRVLILHDIPRLDPAAVDAITAFVTVGGGLLLTVGDRADRAWYNDKLYKSAAGLLPARLDVVATQETRPDPSAFSHPILAVFSRDQSGGFSDARFPRWTRLQLPPGLASKDTAVSSPVGILRFTSPAPGTSTRAGPLMAERRLGSGRVILSAVPLDASWGTNLVELPAFVPLVHETMYYLAAARSAEFNLRPGQPIVHRIPLDTKLSDCRLTPPDGRTLPLDDTAQTDAPTNTFYPAKRLSRDGDAILSCAETQTPGTYRLQVPRSDPIVFVVADNPRESDLQPCTREDRDRVYQIIHAEDLDPASPESATDAGTPTTIRHELWWYALLGLMSLLLFEVYLTRRMALNR